MFRALDPCQRQTLKKLKKTSEFIWEIMCQKRSQSDERNNYKCIIIYGKNPCKTKTETTILTLLRNNSISIAVANLTQHILFNKRMFHSGLKNMSGNFLWKFFAGMLFFWISQLKFCAFCVKLNYILKNDRSSQAKQRQQQWSLWKTRSKRTWVME